MLRFTDTLRQSNTEASGLIRQVDCSLEELSDFLDLCVLTLKPGVAQLDCFCVVPPKQRWKIGGAGGQVAL